MARPSRWLQCRLAVDRLLAAALLVPAAPVIAVLAALVRRHDGAPPLIQVPRVGRHGNTFGMWKLRSMRAATSDGRAGGAALTGSDDARITPIGAAMRSLHLDELPQLLNVVRGEMCLLGPRPEAPDFVDDADPRWRAVLQVPPGIAGPTQIVVGAWERRAIDADTDGGAYRRTVLPVKLALDEWYVGSASPALDATVLAALVRHSLPGAESPALLRRAGDVPEASEPLAHLRAEGTGRG